MPNKRLPGPVLLAAGVLACAVAIVGCNSRASRGSAAPALSRTTSAAAALDAATPYAGAQVARRALPTARMVVVAGGGNHGQSLAQPPNTCVNSYLNGYLATGALPQRPGLVNAVCPALPPPPPLR